MYPQIKSSEEQKDNNVKKNNYIDEKIKNVQPLGNESTNLIFQAGLNLINIESKDDNVDQKVQKIEKLGEVLSMGNEAVKQMLKPDQENHAEKKDKNEGQEAVGDQKSDDGYSMITEEPSEISEFSDGSSNDKLSMENKGSGGMSDSSADPSHKEKTKD